MNNKRLLCLLITLSSFFFAQAQSGSVLFDNLGGCLDYPENTIVSEEENPRTSFIKNNFKINPEQFKQLDYSQIEIYVRSLIVRSRSYITEERYKELREMTLESSFCALYDWHAYAIERKAINNDKIRELERRLYLRPLSLGRPTFAIRLWQYDLDNNIYNIFQLRQKSNNAIKADYLKFEVDETGVMLDSFDNNMACNGSTDNLLGTIKAFNWSNFRDQTTLPFLRQPDERGKVLAIEVIEDGDRRRMMYIDVEKYAEEEVAGGPNTELIRLLEVIEEYYGAKLE